MCLADGLGMACRATFHAKLGRNEAHQMPVVERTERRAWRGVEVAAGTDELALGALDSGSDEVAGRGGELADPTN